jgi:hypothetical protein
LDRIMATGKTPAIRLPKSWNPNVRSIVHAHGPTGRDLSPIFPAIAWRKFRWTTTQGLNVTWPG